MFELLVPATTDADKEAGDAYDRDIRPGHMVRAIHLIQDFGIEPDIWKIEGVDRREDAERVAAAVRRGSHRQRVGSIVLGRGSDAAQVHEWLRVAAPVEGFIGFAVGRTNFREPLAAHLAGQLDEGAAISPRSPRTTAPAWTPGAPREPDPPSRGALHCRPRFKPWDGVRSVVAAIGAGFALTGDAGSSRRSRTACYFALEGDGDGRVDSMRAATLSTVWSRVRLLVSRTWASGARRRGRRRGPRRCGLGCGVRTGRRPRRGRPRRRSGASRAPRAGRRGRPLSGLSGTRRFRCPGLQRPLPPPRTAASARPAPRAVRGGRPPGTRRRRPRGARTALVTSSPSRKTRPSGSRITR